MPLTKIETKMFNSLAEAGKIVIDILEKSGYSIIVFIQSIFFIKNFWQKRSEIIKQMYIAGVKSFLVVTIVAFFTGMILALQSGIELRRFGMQHLIGQLVIATLTREMAPFSTAIVLIASVGSSIAAEIAAMKVSEEIDALEMLLIDPIKFLVMPRLIALAVMFPVISIYFCLMGVAGGGIVANTQLGLEFDTYFKYVMIGLHIKAMYVGLLKAFIFGITVAIVSSANGLRAVNGVAGVGQATRTSVITSFLMILVSGYYITAYFYG